MDYEEEQQTELETLQAICGDDFKELDGPKHFKIAIDPEEATDMREPVHLEIRYTAKYPEELPEIRVLQSHMLAAKGKQLQDFILKTAEEEKGNAMVYTLVQAAKDWLQNPPDDVQPSQAQEGGASAYPEKSNQSEGGGGGEGGSKYKDIPSEHGTPVTVENFLAWREKFEAEMNALRSAEIAAEEEKLKRLTGRRMFELNAELASSDLAMALSDAYTPVPEDEQREEDEEDEEDDDEDEDYVPGEDDEEDDDDDEEFPPEEDPELEAALAAGVRF